MIEQAARAAARRAGRLRPVSGYTRDEALQDARIGAWCALGVPAESAEHRAALLALAGYRNILDGRDARWNRSAGGEREHELLPEHDGEAPDAAAGLCVLAEVLAAIERMRDPLPVVARMLIEGYELAEIGQRIGVSASRVCRHRRTLQQTVSKLLEVTA